ncbi:MAG: recombination mediator RecR [Spirochaetaceae bacterium]|nr:recombination mediator RecR [Spirochaetaceae bacterium]
MERLDRLINSFARLPGIGRKSASRISYWLLETDRTFVDALAADLGEIRAHVVRCRECGNYAETELCDVCRSPVRDSDVMCVVEQSRDVATIEATGEFRGLYHVLHGVLSPLDGVGPEELGLGRMLSRIQEKGVKEVIVATNPTLEGDSTALYIVRMLSSKGVKVSRIASGLPVGGDMEYADKLSVARALRARQNLDES